MIDAAGDTLKGLANNGNWPLNCASRTMMILMMSAAKHRENSAIIGSISAWRIVAVSLLYG